MKNYKPKESFVLDKLTAPNVGNHDSVKLNSVCMELFSRAQCSVRTVHSMVRLLLCMTGTISGNFDPGEV